MGPLEEEFPVSQVGVAGWKVFTPGKFIIPRLPLRDPNISKAFFDVSILLGNCQL